MAEGRTYVIEWTRSGDIWSLHVRGSPYLRASRATLADAKRELSAQICLRFGDGEPVFTFDPPLPTRASDDSYLRENFAVFDGSGYTQLRNRYPFELFTGGPCRHCGYPTGQRTDSPVQLDGPIREHVTSCPYHYYSPLVVSQKFLSLLTDSERACCEWRKCEREQHTRRVMYELVPRVVLPLAIPRTFRVGGWRCTHCELSVNGVLDESTDILKFVRRDQLPDPIPELFGVGSLVLGMVIAGRAPRLRELLRHKHSLGMRVHALGVLNPTDTNEVDSLPLRESGFTPKLERLVVEYCRDHYTDLAARSRIAK